MYSYILSLYYLSGTVVGIEPGDTLGVHRQTEVSMIRELRDLLVATR